MINSLKVEMPKKKIYKAKRNNINYIYFILRSYRNNKGQPTCDSILIGKMDDETGMLIPNDNFFNIYDCDISIKVNGLKKTYME